MRDRFEIAMPFCLGEEIGPFVSTAGYVSAACAAQIGDSGGETVAGVARTKNPDWPGWAIVDRRKKAQTGDSSPAPLASIPSATEAGFPNNLNLDLPQNAELKRLIGELYREKYWDRFRCGELPPGLDLCMFDAAVQHLPKPAVRLLQMALRVAADGTIGQATLAAAHGANREEAILRYLVERQKFYMDILVANSSLAPNRDGWFARLFRLQAYILGNR